MNKIYYLVIFLLCVSVVHAKEDWIQLNASEFNASVGTSLNISLLEGYNASIYMNETDSRLNYTFNEYIYFEFSNISVVNFNVSLNHIFTSSENITQVFWVTNDYDNESLSNYTLHTEILYHDTVEIKPDYFVDVVNGDYIVSITTDLIPKKGDLKYKIKGVSGEKLSIDCIGEWLSCPDFKTFNNENYTEFSVTYLVPDSTPKGEYKSRLNLSSGNLSLEKEIIFKIKEPDIVISSYQFREDCFKKADDGTYLVTEECIIEQEEFNNRRLRELLNDLNEEPENLTCETVLNHTEYIYKGSYDEALQRELNLCVTERDSCNSNFVDQQKVVNNYENKLGNKDSEINKCQKTLSSVQKTLIQNETNCLANAVKFEDKVKKENEKLKEIILEEGKEYKSKVRNRNIFIWVAIIASLLSYYVIKKHRQEHGWEG